MTITESNGKSCLQSQDGRAVQGAALRSQSPRGGVFSNPTSDRKLVIVWNCNGPARLFLQLFLSVFHFSRIWYPVIPTSVRLPTGFRCVVVITFASHAKGPRFETERKQLSCLAFHLHHIHSATLQKEMMGFACHVTLIHTTLRGLRTKPSAQWNAASASQITCFENSHEGCPKTVMFNWKIFLYSMNQLGHAAVV